MKWQLLDRKQSGRERGDGIGKGLQAGTVRNGSATVLYVSTLPTFFLSFTAGTLICHWPSGFVTLLKATVWKAKTNASPVEPQITHNLPSLISAARAQSVNPDGAAQAFTVRHDSLISDLDFQTELRSAEATCPLRIRNIDSRAKQHCLLHDVLLAYFASVNSKKKRDILRAQRRKTKNKSV